MATITAALHGWVDWRLPFVKAFVSGQCHIAAAKKLLFSGLNMPKAATPSQVRCAPLALHCQSVMPHATFMLAINGSLHMKSSVCEVCGRWQQDGLCIVGAVTIRAFRSCKHFNQSLVS